MTKSPTTEDNELDTAIRNFKEYVKGNGSFDELDFKEYIIDGLVAKAELAMLNRLLLIGTGRIILDDRDGWKEFATSYINFCNSLLDERNTLKGKK